MFSAVIVFIQTFPAEHSKSICCQRFFPPVFHCDSGKPQGNLLFGLLLSLEEFSQNVLTIEIVLGYDTDPAGCLKCHRPLSGPACRSWLVGAIWAIWRLLNWEIEQQVLKPPASLAMSNIYGISTIHGNKPNSI